MGEHSSDNEKTLTEEQKELIKLLEVEFKDRYTEADGDFKLVWESNLPPPPIFMDWEKVYENRPSHRYRRDYRRNPGEYRQQIYGPYYRSGRRPY